MKKESRLLKENDKMRFIGDDEDNVNQRFKLELEGKNELIILGLNPSTARGESSGYPNMIDDPTLNRAVEFSKRNWNWDKTITEFDGFLMLNVCAQSTSKPINLVVNDALHEMNKKKIEEYLSGKMLYRFCLHMVIMSAKRNCHF